MEQLPDRVDLSVGEERKLAFPGLGTAGYVWQEQIPGAADLVTVTWHRGFPPNTEPAAIGISAPEIATIHAIRAGEVVLRFVQIRPWERTVAPKQEKSVIVRVAERVAPLQ